MSQTRVGFEGFPRPTLCLYKRRVLLCVLQDRAKALAGEHQAMMQSSAGPFVSRVFFDYMQSQVDVLAAHCEHEWLRPHIAVCRRVLVRHLCSDAPRIWHFWACQRAVLQSMHSMLELTDINAQADTLLSDSSQRRILRGNFRLLQSRWRLLQAWLRRCDKAAGSREGSDYQHIPWLQESTLMIQAYARHLEQGGAADPLSSVAQSAHLNVMRISERNGLVDGFTSDPALVQAQQALHAASRRARVLQAHAQAALDGMPALDEIDRRDDVCDDVLPHSEGGGYGWETDEYSDDGRSDDGDDSDSSLYHTSTDDSPSGSGSNSHSDEEDGDEANEQDEVREDDEDEEDDDEKEDEQMAGDSEAEIGEDDAASGEESEDDAEGDGMSEDRPADGRQEPASPPTRAHTHRYTTRSVQLHASVCALPKRRTQVCDYPEKRLTKRCASLCFVVQYRSRDGGTTAC